MSLIDYILATSKAALEVHLGVILLFVVVVLVVGIMVLLTFTTYLRRGFMCNCCMQHAAMIAGFPTCTIGPVSK